MAIGTPVELGVHAQGTASTSNVLTTSTAAPAGDAIIVIIQLPITATTTPTVADTASNTYTVTTPQAFGVTGKLCVARCANPAALSSGSTITVSWSGSGKSTIGACSVSGLDPTAPLDVTGTTVTGTGASATVSTGGLSQADEIVFGMVATSGTAGAFTQATGFTAFSSIGVGTGNIETRWGYKIVSSTSSVTYNPSWATSRIYGADVYSFKAAAAATKLAPSTAWNGTPGTGFGGSNPSAPANPTRGSAGAWCQPLFIARQVFTADGAIGVMAGAKGGLSKVRFWCEGNFIDVTSRSWQTITDANGASKAYYGWWATLDWTTAQSIHANGIVQCYFETFPNDPSISGTVLGPYTFCTRTTEFDQTVVIAKTSGTTLAPWGTATITGVDAMKAALALAVANPTQFYRIVCIETADYRISDATVKLQSSTHNTVIMAASGITATMGDGTFSGSLYTAPRVDGVEFRGSNVVLNYAKLSGNLTWLYAIDSGSDGWLILNGCTVQGGSAVYANQGGSGQNLLYYGQQPGQFWIGPNNAGAPKRMFLAEVSISDMPAYGFIGAEMVRGGSITDVSGSGLENCMAAQGMTLRRIGGGGSALRTYTPAMTVNYAGAGTGYVQKTGDSPTFGGNGNSGAFNLYESGWNLTGYISGTTLTVTAVSGPNLQVGTWIANAAGSVLEGTKITALGTGSGGAGTYTVSRSQTIGSSGSPVTLLAPRYSFTITSSSNASLTTQISSIISGIGGSPNWSASSVGGANTTAAPYLAYNNGVNVPSSAIPIAAVAGGSITLSTIFDIHSDAIAFHGGGGVTTLTNACLEFIEIYENATTTHLAFNGSGGETYRDFHVGNTTCNDVSSGLGVPQQQSYMAGTWQHVVIENNIEDAVGAFWSSVSADSYSYYQRNLNNNLSVGSGTAPEAGVYYGLLVRTGSLPANASATNKSAALGGVAFSTLANTSFVPVSGGGLLLSDGTYAGAKVPTALTTAGNQGWNLTVN